jgi:RNA polymerase sigma-70 factor (ECF subfamily)
MTTETMRVTHQHASAGRSAEQDDVRRAAEGDATAFERLYRTHAARIHSLCRRMAGPEDADDLTQEVFVRAWRKLASFRGDAAFGTWLFRLGVNVVLARRATMGSYRARFTTEADSAAPLEERGRGPVPVGSRLDLERAIGKLPEGARRVFVLHDVEGYKHEEIAEMLSITAGTSKSQLHRARMTLREHLT